MAYPWWSKIYWLVTIEPQPKKYLNTELQNEICLYKFFFSSEKARTLVLGTPIHKQKSGWHIQQQERRRLRDDVQSDVQTVAESPMKGTHMWSPIVILNQESNKKKKKKKNALFLGISCRFYK